MVPFAVEAPTYECPPLRGATLRLWAAANAIAFWTSAGDLGATIAAGVESLKLVLKTCLAAPN